MESVNISNQVGNVVEIFLTLLANTSPGVTDVAMALRGDS